MVLAPEQLRHVRPARRLGLSAGAVADSLSMSGGQGGYDATQSRGRRQPPKTLLWSEDRHLPPLDRRALVATLRDLHRNFALAKWMLNKHLDYVSTFTFQARTPDDDLNKRIEDLVAWWSLPENFDIAARHGRQRMTRLAEARRTMDGDLFILKMADGRLQALEGDRVATPLAGLPAGFRAAEYVHGVRTDKAGRMLEVAVCTRGASGRDLRFERTVPAVNLEHHAYFDRLDQVRGISPMAPAVNGLRDQQESIEYALAKAKISQLFGMIFYRDFVEQAEDANATDYSKLDLNRGPFKLDLAPGDRAEFLESQTPSGEFVAFQAVMTAMDIKSLDIPYSFYDESHSNYSGSRQAMLQYEQSADIKRGDNRLLLDRLTRWRIGMWIRNGTLLLPPSVGWWDIKWDWVPAGIPWIDPLKETNADVAAVKALLRSRTRICRERGEDFYEICDEQARENAYARKLGLDPSGLSFAPAPADEPAQPRKGGQE